jgi:hypothetical protein
MGRKNRRERRASGRRNGGKRQSLNIVADGLSSATERRLQYRVVYSLEGGHTQISVRLQSTEPGNRAIYSVLKGRDTTPA